MSLFAFFMGWVTGQVALLGSPDWEARERAQARLCTPALAWALPVRDPDPEVAFRLERIRARYHNWVDPAHAARLEFRAAVAPWQLSAWVDKYFVSGPGEAALNEGVLFDMRRANFTVHPSFYKVVTNDVREAVSWGPHGSYVAAVRAMWRTAPHPHEPKGASK